MDSRVFPATIQSVQQITSTTFLVRLSRDSGFAFQAGQHLRLKLGEKGADIGYFSIASPPEAPGVELIVRAPTVAGQTPLVADRLVRMNPGDPVSFEGPFGGLRFNPAVDRHACLIAQGTGVAPLFSILRSQSYSDFAPRSVLLLVGFRDETELIGLELFGSPLPPARYLVTLSRPRTPGWPGLIGRVTDHLERGPIAIDWKHTDFYLCGSAEMVGDVKAILTARGVDPARVHSD